MPTTKQVITNTFRATRGRREYVRAGNKLRLVYTPMKGWWKPATCEEVDCLDYLRGWSLPLDFSPAQKPEDLLEAQGAHHWIENSGRKYTNRWDGSTCIYQFEPGQTCYRKHQIPVERDPVFLHVTGPDRFKQMDYDEFFDAHNESAYRSNQNQHIR